MEEKKNEAETKNSEIKKIDLNLDEILKSLCKIIFKNELGIGFFIKLFKDDKELLCLMTNEHVIRKEMIESNININEKISQPYFFVFDHFLFFLTDIIIIDF